MTDDAMTDHRATWERLPWIVNGSATPAERQQAQLHLASCVDCRDELALQSLIHAGMHAEAGTGSAAGASLARLFERIDDAEALEGGSDPSGTEEANGFTAVMPPSTAWRRHRTTGIAALLIAQTIAVLVLGHALTQRPDRVDAADYQTLTRAVAASPLATIRFVPAPQLSVGDLQTMLDAAGVHIVESRGHSAIYGLAPIDGDAGARDAISTAAIARLRGQAGVLLVEPIARETSDSSR